MICIGCVFFYLLSLLLSTFVNPSPSPDLASPFFLQSTGTTLVCLSRPTFLILACDSRTTMGTYISSDSTVKVRRIQPSSLTDAKKEVLAGVKGRSTEEEGDFVYLLGAGVSGDVVDVVKLLRSNVDEQVIKGEAERGAKRQANNTISSIGNRASSYFRTRCASFVINAIILTHHPNSFPDSLRSSQVRVNCP